MLDALSVVSILSGLSSILGYSLRDLLKDKGTEKRENLALAISRFLSVFEQENDPIVGFWSVCNWKYESESHSNYYVSGNLAILYRNPQDKIWHGILFLKYQRKITPGVISKPNGWLAKKRGNFIECSYDIEMQEKSQGEYYGTSTQKYRNPHGGFKATGEFNLKLNKDGTMMGNFKNKNILGTSEISFHQHKKWREI